MKNKNKFKIDVAKIEKKDVSIQSIVDEVKKVDKKGGQKHFLIARNEDQKCEEIIDIISRKLGERVSAIKGKVISIDGYHTVEVTAPNFYNAMVKNAKAGFGARIFNKTHLRTLK